MKTSGKIISVFCLTFLSACGPKMDFEKMPGALGNTNAQNNPTNPSCSTSLNTYDKNLRIIFMVDDSGSTFNTDPNFIYRKQSIQNFIAQYGAKANFTYAFGEFGNDTAAFYNVGSRNFDTSGANVFGTSLDINIALNMYVQSLNHGGDTPYISALDAINKVVVNDVMLPGYETDYAVVFMSDGAPSDTSDPGNGPKTDSDLQNLISQVLQSASTHKRLLSMNTIYFGPNAGVVDDSDGVTADEAKSHLQTMATAGSGQFLDTNKIAPGSTLNIDSVVTVPCIN